MIDKLLTPEDVTYLTGITREALAQLRYTGKGPVFLKPTARTVLYREHDIANWLDASERSITGRDA
jgi:hypothetical protein